MFGLTPRRRRRGSGRWPAPFRHLDVMEDMVGGFHPPYFEKEQAVEMLLPAFNVYRDGENFVVEVSAPGYEKEDVSIEMHDDLLTITGRRREEEEKEDKDYLFREFRAGSFSRSIRVPGPVDPDKLKAKYRNGVLKVYMPYAEAEKRSKTIEIE